MFLWHLENHICEYGYKMIEGKCIHEPLTNFNIYNTFGYFLILLIVGFSTVGGLGGGIEKIPILILMFNYN